MHVIAFAQAAVRAAKLDLLVMWSYHGQAGTVHMFNINIYAGTTPSMLRDLQRCCLFLLQASSSLSDVQGW